MTERLNYIRKLVKEKGIIDILENSNYIVLGKNVKIKQGAILGTDGFGYERNEINELEKFPHFGKLIIGNNVDIGANTCIDRGNTSDTIIGNGTKIDNLVHIGHNAKIGNNCLIAAHVIIGGSAEIGNGCTIWVNSFIGEHVKIGKNCIIGACSFVNKNIPDNSIVYGIPAKIIKKLV